MLPTLSEWLMLALGFFIATIVYNVRFRYKVNRGLDHLKGEFQDELIDKIKAKL